MNPTPAWRATSKCSALDSSGAAGRGAVVLGAAARGSREQRRCCRGIAVHRSHTRRPARRSPTQASGQPLASGASDALFTVTLPTGAACSGDTSTGGYHVYSYLVPHGHRREHGDVRELPVRGLRIRGQHRHLLRPGQHRDPYRPDHQHPDELRVGAAVLNEAQCRSARPAQRRHVRYVGRGNRVRRHRPASSATTGTSRSPSLPTAPTRTASPGPRVAAHRRRPRRPRLDRPPRRSRVRPPR